MAQEEHFQKYSNSSSGGGPSGSGGGGGGSGCNNNGGGSCSGRSQKKMKQKKVPQRGLGVAQLEKIRLEEQQKKGVVLQSANILSPNHHQIISPSNSSSCLAVQCPTFRPSITSASSAPLQPPSPSDLPSPNSLFRPTPSIPSIPPVDILNPNSVPLPKTLNVGGGDMGWSAVPVPGHGSTWPKVWNGEFGIDRENHRQDHHHGFAFRPNMSLPFESCPPTPFLPLPNALQRSQQFQQQSSSSMVNISSGISPSSILNFQIEPPSNQNFCGSNYTPLWPDEEKMVGMKRPYPFSMETPPAPAFHFKFSPCCVASVPRLDEPSSCSNSCTVNTDPGFCAIREGPSRSSTLSEPTHTEVKATENGMLNGDFLTLAPPATASPHLSSKCSLASSGPLSREFSEFGFQTSQLNGEETIPGQGPSKSMRPPFFSFFPAAKKEIGQGSSNNCNGEVGEKVDLSLKL